MYVNGKEKEKNYNKKLRKSFKRRHRDKMLVDKDSSKDMNLQKDPKTFK